MNPIGAPETGVEFGLHDLQPEEPEVREVDINRGLRVSPKIGRPRFARRRAAGSQHRCSTGEAQPGVRQRIALSDRADQEAAAVIGRERLEMGGQRRGDDHRRAVGKTGEADAAGARPATVRRQSGEAAVIGRPEQRFGFGQCFGRDFASGGIFARRFHVLPTPLPAMDIADPAC